MWDPLSLAPFLGYVILWFFNLTGSYGFAIVLLTLFVKLLMFPFVVKNQKAMAGSIRYTEKQKEIRNRYKNDRKKLNEELMNLSQKEHVSMFGGCFTNIFPLIVFLAMSSTVTFPLSNILHVDSQKIEESNKIVKNFSEVKDKKEAEYYNQINIIKLFPSNKDKFLMFNKEEAKRIEDFSGSFSVFGTDLLATPKYNLFEGLLWAIPLLSFLISVLDYYISQKLRQVPLMQDNEGCMKFVLYLPMVLGAWFAYSYPAAVGFYYIVVKIIDLAQRFVIEKFYGVYLINAKKEAARILRRISEEKMVKTLT
jgi:YidC/Oxa1 family membrane protein insertase